MKTLLTSIITFSVVAGTVVFMHTTNTPEYRECDGYSNWQTRFVPARCISYFINQ